MSTVNIPAPASISQPSQAPQQFQSLLQNQNPAPAADPAPTAPAPAAPANTDALTAAIAALTAAFQGNPAQAPAPAAAPEEPQAPTNIPAAGTNVGNLNDLDIDGLDDPAMRGMAQALLAGAPDGFDIDRAIGQAVATGDASRIDRAYLIEKFGARAVGQIAIAEGLIASVNAQASAQANTVYAAAGGQQQWNAAATAFNSGAPSELRAIVANMLDSGNKTYIDAAAKLVVSFGASSGLIPKQQAGLTAVAGVGNASALDKAGFQAELRKLNPSDRNFAQSRAELFARRQLGVQLGR